MGPCITDGKSVMLLMLLTIHKTSDYSVENILEGERTPGSRLLHTATTEPLSMGAVLPCTGDPP